MSPFHYTSSGLDYIWLRNGFEVEQTAYGEAVAIRNIPGLHQAIGRYIACNLPHITSKELRFLRKEMDLSQARLGELLGTGESSIRNWENKRHNIPGSVDRLMRILYLERLDGDGSVRELIERIVSIDRKNYNNQCYLEDTGKYWRTAA